MMRNIDHRTKRSNIVIMGVFKEMNWGKDIIKKRENCPRIRKLWYLDAEGSQLKAR